LPRKEQRLIFGNSNLELTVAWLYGHEMNIYGDRGNVMALVRRGQWRNIEMMVETIGPGDHLDCTRFDLYFWGGGQDREQASVARDLHGAKGQKLAAAIENGVPILAICGGYQLLGHYYRPHAAEDLPGIGVMNITSEAGNTRFIGNVVVNSPTFGRLVGFENHSGLTFLGDGVNPLGTIEVGAGNNGRDGASGAMYKNAIGCYHHGALLPKNPVLTDWLIQKALEQKYGSATLAPIESNLELRAQRTVTERTFKLGR
jgi:CobQ-like glutamine amidotransferase family enzyme